MRFNAALSIMLALSFIMSGSVILISPNSEAIIYEGSFHRGDIYFTGDDESLTVTGYDGPGGDVTIPAYISGVPVTAIGENAFKYASVVKITIPSTVITISANAFNSSSALYEVILPDTLTNIGERAFYNCINLAIINIPSELETIGDYAFAYCESIGGAAGTITIPESLNSLGDYAFYNCSGMYNLIIKDGLTAFGDYAFGECDALELIYIPGTITNTGTATFYGCDSLTDAIIGNGTTTVGVRSFSHCALLDTVRMSQTVTTIGNYAFEYCTSLGDIAFNKGVTSIGSFALSNSGIHTIYFQGLYTGAAASLPTIGASWLDGVSGTPNSYSFPWSAFTAGSYEGTTMAKTLSNYTYSGEHFIRYFGATNAYTLPYYTTGSTVLRYFDSYCFYGNTDLTSLDMDGMTTYWVTGDYCFAYCTNLLTVFYDNTMSQMGNYNFLHCHELRSLFFLNGGTTVETDLEDGTFQHCWSLESIDLPVWVARINQEAFYGCEKLWDVEFEGTITSIGFVAFAECTDLEEIEIPGTVATVGEASFYRCISLWNVTLNSGTTKIGSWAFEKCYALETLVIPDSVTEIDDYAIEYCTSLTSITLSNNLTRLGYSVFDSCMSLESIFLPASLKTLGDNWTNMTAGVFDRCTSLTNIAVHPDNTEFISIGGVLFSKDQTILIQYPNGKGGSYVIPSSVTWLMPGAFYWAIYLTEVTIPSSVTAVNYASFASCDSLTTVNFPSTLTIIDDLAFQLCPLLDDITVPASVDYIGNNSFYFCRGLETLTIENGCQEIRQLAFYACTSLVYVYIPDSVYLLDNFSFAYCFGLEEIRLGQGLAWIGLGCFLEDSALNNIYFYSEEVPIIDIVWIEGTPETIRGHALEDSEFPAPGQTLYTDFYSLELSMYDAPTGLLMGDVISSSDPYIPSEEDDALVDGELVTSMIMVLVFFIPAIILGSMFHNTGVLFGIGMMSVVYGVAYPNGLPILFIGILGVAVIALSMREGDDNGL